jgi:hypothetical protein
MSTKKTIQINPELFKLTGNKTRKNKEKKELTLNPIVTPNNLKNKLQDYIAVHIRRTDALTHRSYSHYIKSDEEYINFINSKMINKPHCYKY